MPLCGLGPAENDREWWLRLSWRDDKRDKENKRRYDTRRTLA